MNVRVMLLTTVSKCVTTLWDPTRVNVTLDMIWLIMATHVKVQCDKV